MIRVFKRSYKDVVMACHRAVMKMNYKDIYVLDRQGYIEATVPGSILSFGESIQIHVKDLTDCVRVEISSTSIKNQIFSAYGKNARNERSISSLLESLLKPEKALSRKSKFNRLKIDTAKIHR